MEGLESDFMKGLRHHLTLSLILIGFPLVTMGVLLAQQVTPDTDFVAPRPSAPKTETLPIEKPVGPDITGIVAQAFKMKKPLQMISPLAPSKYGDGQDNVSWDPDKPEKPKGIILLGIQW